MPYHNYDELQPSVYEGIRETYEGPVSGPTRQPPPGTGRADVMTDFSKVGEWGPGFNAQNRMLDEYREKFNLQEEKWRAGEG